MILGVSLRVVYFFWSQKLPFFDSPITDALYHHRWAMAIADGMWWDGKAFFRAPFYPYVLGSLYTLLGPHIWIGKVFGHLAGLCTGAMIITLSDRLFGRREAAIAAALWLGSGLVMFYEGELLLDSFFTFLVTASVYTLLARPPSIRGGALAGLVFGLAAITRPTVLAVIPVVIFWLWWRADRRPWRLLASFGIAAALPVSAVMSMNARALGHLDGIATQGGINLYIGNNPAADGVSAVLPAPWGYAWHYRDLKRHAEAQTGEPLDDAQVSDFYYARALDFIVSEPVAFAALSLKKLVLSVSRFTVSNNLDLQYVQRELPILKWLPVRVAWLVPLALAGWPYKKRSLRIYASLWAFIALYTSVLVLFFMVERFRLPLVPVWIILASFGASALWDGTIRARAAALGLILVGIVAVYPNWYNLREENEALAYFNLGNVALRSGGNRHAAALYDTALTFNTDLHQLRLNRGLARLRLSDLDEAQSDFLQEAGRFTFDARPFNNLAALYLLTGDTLAAQAAIDSGLARDSSLPLLYLQCLSISQNQADTISMAATLARAERHTPGLPVWLYWRGELARLTGAGHEARDAYMAFIAARKTWPSLDGEDQSYAGPSPERVDYQIGLTYLGEAQIDSAATYFGRAALADSTFSEAWSNWGTAALSEGQFSLAAQRYRVAVGSTPESPLLWTNLAYAHAQAGEMDSAYAALVNALAADSTFLPARALAEELRTH
jgi:Flp pilus assembly protein TadD